MSAPLRRTAAVFMTCCAMLISLACASDAHAHRVNIFAWTEGTTIHSEATFSSGNKAQKSHVTATEKPGGNVIAEGDTNEIGIWSFTLPADVLARKPDIVLSLNAGEGHVNTWTITAAEYSVDAPASDTTQTTPAAGSSDDANADMPPFMESTTTPQPTPTSLGVNSAELQTIVEAALEKKLAPIRRQLAEESQHTPSLQDILGGIGYILGLMGIAAYMSARKRK